MSNWKHFVAVFFVKLPKATSFVFDEGEIQATKRVSTKELEERLKQSPDDFVISAPSIRKLVKEKIEEM